MSAELSICGQRTYLSNLVQPMCGTNKDLKKQLYGPQMCPQWGAVQKSWQMSLPETWVMQELCQAGCSAASSTSALLPHVSIFAGVVLWPQRLS